MKDLNYVASEITKEKNLEMNLPKFANSMMSLYNGLAYVKLSMNYYTYFEMLNDREYENTDLAKIKDYMDRLNIIIEKEVITEGSVESLEESIVEVDNIRNEIMKIMEVVTSYVDKLKIYEYILNRVEFKFSEEEFDEEYYSKNLTNDLMHFILNDKDSMVTNSKIAEVIGQLPIRLSKNKFYDYIKASFTLYRGAQKGTIDDFVYALRTTAMLDQPDGFEDSFRDVNEIYNDLKDADYKNLSQEEYKSLADKLLIATQIMANSSDLFVILMQLVNDVYTIILSKMYAFNNVDEINKSKYVIKSTLEGFNGNEYDSDDDKIIDCFTGFEGQQEKIIMVTTSNEHVIDYVLKNQSATLQSIMLEKAYNSLLLIFKLQSGSDFIGLYESTDKQEIASNEYVDISCDKFIAELDTLFKDSSQIINRAVMSTVLSQLPVFFNNLDEIQSYINTSLLQCSDKAEKMACIAIMNLLMEDGN